VGGYSAACNQRQLHVQACTAACRTFQASELLRQRLRSDSGSAHGALTRRLRERLVLFVGISLAVAEQVDVHRLRGQDSHQMHRNAGKSKSPF
jgi:hypothetical protein